MARSRNFAQWYWRTASYLLHAFRGAASLLAGLAFPLGGWWIGRQNHLRTEQRLQNGCIFILPGVEGKSSLPLQIALGLADGGTASAIEIHDWTTGFWPLFLYHLRRERRARSQAARIASRILEYQGRYPGKPTFLVGHSGGGAVAVLVLESLPVHRRVTAALLLGPALSRRYDLTKALSRTEAGIWNYYSPLDLIFLTAGTFVFGTIDSRHDVSAGAWGFSRPAHLPSRGRRHFRTRLHQCGYERVMAAYCHFGGHLGWANRMFVANRLGAIVKSLEQRPGRDSKSGRAYS